MEPHGLDLVVCQGNQLHVMYEDHLESDATIWYATRQVTAPHVSRSPWPAPKPSKASSSRALITSTVTSVASEETDSYARFDKQPHTSSIFDLMSPLVIASAGVALFLFVMMGAYILRNR